MQQRLLAAACVQKQLAQQAAEFKRRFGEWLHSKMLLLLLLLPDWLSLQGAQWPHLDCVECVMGTCCLPKMTWTELLSSDKYRQATLD